MRGHWRGGLTTNVEQAKSLPEVMVFSWVVTNLLPWTLEVGVERGNLQTTSLTTMAHE